MKEKQVRVVKYIVGLEETFVFKVLGKSWKVCGDATAEHGIGENNDFSC